MKKWMILAAAVVLAAPVFAQTQEAFPSYIQVNGRSQMEVTPDEFYLSIVINERESKGKITVETQQRQMIDALKKLGVDVEKQLKVANMSSDFYKKASSLTTAKYQLLLHSAAEVGDVTAALGDLGISNVGIVRVTRSDIDSLKEQVRLDAIRNAKSSAEALAGMTSHAARALGLADRGTLEVGKRADLALWDIELPAELAYRMGARPLIRRWVADPGDT